MALPIKNGHIGTPYGKPGAIWMAGHHQGVDFPTPVGTPVLAAADGTVIGVGQCWGLNFGNHQVIVKHVVEKRAFYTIYAHCSSDFVKVGEEVKKGQKIALSGAEGHVTGPHLHFEAHTVSHWDTKTDVNPQPLLDA
jgi:murein DD-endopeptidase MepM/ murein hydrolase activator NlpD